MTKHAIAVLLAVLASPAAFAQQSAERRVEVGANLRLLTGVQFKDVNANELAFGGATRALFKSTSRFEPAACAEARVTVGLTSLLEGEASIAFGRAQLTTKITQDQETSDATITESVTDYLVEGGVVAHLARWQRRRAAPYASAGIGYLRQVHEGHTLVSGGPAAYVGAGVHYALKEQSGGGLRVAGLRAELRGSFLMGDVALDGATHVLPAVIAGVFFHF